MMTLIVIVTIIPATGGDSESNDGTSSFSDAAIIGSDVGNNNNKEDKDADGKYQRLLGICDANAIRQ